MSELNFSSKYIKNSALEGTFSATQNMVSFSIPSGMKVDLSETHVIVDLSILSSDVNSTASTDVTAQFSGGAGIYRQHITLNDAGEVDTVFPNVAFVKNADIRCEKVGQIESLRRVDTLRIAQYIYMKDVESKMGQAYLTGICNDGVGGMNGSPFRDLVRLGTIKSRNIPGQLRIPLSDIFDVAVAPVFDTEKYGRLDIKLEMNFDKLNVVQTMARTDTNWANGDFGVYQAIDSVDGADNGTPGSTFAGTRSITKFVTTKAYLNPETRSPWYVGQKVVINYQRVNDGTTTQFNFAAGNYRERTIVGLDHNVDDDNKITITLDVGIQFVANDVITAVLFQSPDAGPSPTIVFNKCELEMKQVNAPTPPSIEYTTYSTEEDSGFSGTQTNINKQYTMEGSADNLYICACGVNGGVQKISPTIKINNSRITIDNIEETPEVVIANDISAGNISQAHPLYYDRQDRFYMNLGDDLECLQEQILGQNVALEANPGRAGSAFGQPLPIKATPKQVQLDLNYTAGEIQHLQLYKRMVKKI